MATYTEQHRDIEADEAETNSKFRTPFMLRLNARERRMLKQRARYYGVTQAEVFRMLLLRDTITGGR